MTAERLIAAIMLVALTFGAGLEVDREHLLATLRNVGLIVRALIANFVIVPAAGLLISDVLRLPANVATGFLLMAAAPGVPFVLAGARKKGGRLGLAVALALFLPLLSILTVPLTLALILPPGVRAEFPFAKFAMTLVLFQLLPLLVGIAVGGRFPQAADKLKKPIQIVFFAAIVALVVLLMPKLVHDVPLVYGSHGMWAMLILVLFSFAVGWWFGAPAREDRRILAIGTALRNIGLCALLAAGFDDPRIAAAVITYFIIQFIVTTAFGTYFKRTVKEAAG